MSFEDMMKELQKEYIENLPKKIRLIESQFKNKDIAGLESSFHKIKGTGKTYGVPELSVLSKILEDACKFNKNIDQIVPQSIEILKKIELSRKNGKAFAIEADSLFLDVSKLAA